MTDATPLATLPDRTELTAWFTGPALEVSVVGPVPSVADVGEQLAWLGAALRPSPRDDQYKGLWCCSPSVSCLKALPAAQTGAKSTGDCFEIRFRFEKADDGLSEGQCWHGMFRNPVIVRGFPIATRAVANTGLEVPLGALVQLINTKCITAFDEKIFIKGFSSMLVLTEKRGDLLLWHLIYNASGGRVSYLEYAERPPESFTESQLEGARHVVGWCSKVEILAG